MTNWTQITLRTLHLLTGVFWAGTAFYLTLFLSPALKMSGPGGDAVVRALIVKRKLGVFIPVTAMTTVLTGFALYWRNVSMSSGVWAHSRPGMVFGIGGAAALIALVVGGSMIGPSFQKIVDLQIAAETRGAPLTAAESDQIMQSRKKIGFASNVAFVSLFVAVIAMAIGRYM